MHSSRMRTARRSGRLMEAGGGGCFLPSWVSAQGGVSVQGCLPRVCVCLGGSAQQVSA